VEHGGYVGVAEAPGILLLKYDNYQFDLAGRQKVDPWASA